jgi:hypothetical protein
MMGGLVFLFVFFMVIGLLMVERWIPLFTAIFTGNAKHLEDDILYSGICEKKQKDWDTKYKRRAEEMRKLREAKRRQDSALRLLWGIEDEPIYPQYQPPPPRVVQPVVKREPVDPEMQKLMRELYEDC